MLNRLFKNQTLAHAQNVVVFLQVLWSVLVFFFYLHDSGFQGFQRASELHRGETHVDADCRFCRRNVNAVAAKLMKLSFSSPKN